jgi:GT2 family glycosyltransferase
MTAARAAERTGVSGAGTGRRVTRGHGGYPGRVETAFPLPDRTPPPDDRVSVVIATRDRPAELTRTMTALSALRPPPPVVVVDNASTGSVIRSWHYPGPVRVIALERDRGAAARTVGARYARTPYVAFCDDDSWWAPDALTLAADALDRHPRLALVAARVLVGPAELPDPVTEALARSPLVGDPDLPGRPVLGCATGAVVVRREPFLRVGGFNELLFRRGEDTLLCYDLAAAGWELRYLAPVVAHRHPAGRPAGWRERALDHRNRVLTAWLRRPLPVAVAATAALARAAAGDRSARAALVGVLRRLPAALAVRRPLPGGVERAARLLDQAGLAAAAPTPAPPRRGLEPA